MSSSEEKMDQQKTSSESNLLPAVRAIYMNSGFSVCQVLRESSLNPACFYDRKLLHLEVPVESCVGQGAP